MYNSFLFNDLSNEYHASMYKSSPNLSHQLYVARGLFAFPISLSTLFRWIDWLLLNIISTRNTTN